MRFVTTSPSHVQITPPSLSQPPPTLTQPVQSTSPLPQPSSIQPTSTPPPIQPVETTSSPPITTIPDTQPTLPPSPQIPSPSYHDTEGPSFEPSYHLSPPPSHEHETQTSRSSERSEQLRNLLFKNRVMLEFCGEKEAVNTACYTFNRVRVTKPQNKTPYELLFGHKPILSYIRPFGCHVTILNTLSPLGKFDEKSDEGFLVGYSVNSKAFRVYNLVTKRVEVNLHVNFLEEKPNVQGIGHRWMFDLDYLTDSMNYIPVSLQNQANPAGSKEVIDIDVQTEEAADLMVVSSTSLKEATRKAAVSAKIATKKTPSPKQPSSTPISKSADDIMTFRKELDALALKHLQDMADLEEESSLMANDDEMLKTTTISHLRLIQILLIKDLQVDHPLKHMEHRGIFDSGCSGHMTGNRAHLEDYQELSKVGSVTFGGSKGSISGKVKRIFKYIKGKPKLGLWYPRESPLDLVAYSDSDYAAANLDRKSTTGGCQFLGRRLISWQCKKQTIVATSTTEAEYVAAASCCGQVLWLQNQLLDYGFNFMNTIIHIDNQSTICIIKNPVYHSKTKHIEIRHHFIRDCYEKKLIQVQKIHTDLNVADLLTKAFDGPRYYLELERILQAKLGHEKGHASCHLLIGCKLVVSNDVVVNLLSI
ncbi:putative ribonuclease H-like domain-containing protein [Tanacetum coccineum]